MAITVVTVAQTEGTGAALLTTSATVAVGDYVALSIATDANGSTLTHVASKSSGTATIDTPVLRGTYQQSGGQHCHISVPVTGAGTLVLSISDVAGRRTIVRPLILTGVDGADPYGLNAQGGTSTNDINVGGTCEGAGVLVVGGTEWNDLGNPTSSNLSNLDVDNGAGGSMSYAAGWRTCTAGSVTGNLNAAGAGTADWDWVVAEYREAGGGGSPQTWDGSAATVTIAATSGTFTPGAVTWTGSAATVSMAAASGTFTPGAVTWTASAATVTISATSGTFTAGAVTWTGSATSIAVTALSGEFSSGGSPQTWNGSTGAVAVAATSGTFTPDIAVWAGSSSAVTINGISGVFLAGPTTWAGNVATISIVGTSGIWFIGSAGPVITGPLLTGSANDPRLTDPVPVDRTTSAALGDRTTEAAP